jgi:hypothetical protein
MKTYIALTLLFTLTLPGLAQASNQNKETCKVVTNDVGTIVGRGPSSAQAFEDASTQCFDRHVALYKSKHGTKTDEDTGLLYIDICANVRCS